MNDIVNRQVLLVEKPTGKLGPEHFKMSKGAIPEPKDGEALLRVRYISLDAANRGLDARRDLSRGGPRPTTVHGRRRHRRGRVVESAGGSRRATSCSAIPAGRITLLFPPSI